MAKKKTVKKSGTRRPRPPQNEVQKLAQKLVSWAGKLPKKQQELLERLLSRAESSEITIGGATYEIEPTIEEAVMDALADFRSLNLPGVGWSGWLANWERQRPWARQCHL